MNIFSPDDVHALFKNYHLLFSLVIVVCSFLITYYFIPKVNWVVKAKNLFKPINGRSAHTDQVPALGGVAFFTVFVLMISMIQSFYKLPTGNHLIAAITLVFMVGLKDDLVVSTAKVKFVGQILAALFVVFSPEMEITSLYGFLGIHTIPYPVGCLIALFIMLALVNAYNMIDGINGLAGLIGVVISSVYALTFYMLNQYFFMLLCVVIVGMLIAFLRFNFSRGINKLFMGDSGSLIIGFVIGAMTVKLLSVTTHIPFVEPIGIPTHRVLTILAVLFIPFFDTSRVILVRLMKKKSPFEADQNHSHHILLRMGFCHWKSSLILALVNIAVVVSYAYFSSIFSTFYLTLGFVALYVGMFLLCQQLDGKLKLKQMLQKNTNAVRQTTKEKEVTS